MKTSLWLPGILTVALTASPASAEPRKETSIYEVCQTPNSLSAAKTISLKFHAGVNVFGEPEPVCLVAPPIAQGVLIKAAAVATDSVDHLFGVVLTLSPKGQQVVSAASRKYAFKRIAWVVDSQIMSLATIVEPIEGGTVEIRGIGKYSAERIASVVNGKR